jgi:hypothetical protein
MERSDVRPVQAGAWGGAVTGYGRLARWLGRTPLPAGAGVAALDDRILRDIGLTRSEAEELSR